MHFIPVKYDYSDVYDSLTFFRGDLSGRGSHLDMAGKIAKAGRQWSKAFWRKEDMVAYMFRLEFFLLLDDQFSSIDYT